MSHLVTITVHGIWQAVRAAFYYLWRGWRIARVESAWTFTLEEKVK